MKNKILLVLMSLIILSLMWFQVKSFNGIEVAHPLSEEDKKALEQEAWAALLSDDLDDLNIFFARGDLIRELDQDRLNVLLTEAARIDSDRGTFMVELLLLYGAQVNPDDQQWNLPLNRAVKAGSVSNAQVLINEGADINARDEIYGKTPLHEAAEINNAHTDGLGEKLIILLLNAGADTTIKDEKGRTPFEVVNDIEGRLAFLTFTYPDEVKNIFAFAASAWKTKQFPKDIRKLINSVLVQDLVKTKMASARQYLPDYYYADEWFRKQFEERLKKQIEDGVIAALSKTPLPTPARALSPRPN